MVRTRKLSSELHKYLYQLFYLQFIYPLRPKPVDSWLSLLIEQVVYDHSNFPRLNYLLIIWKNLGILYTASVWNWDSWKPTIIYHVKLIVQLPVIFAMRNLIIRDWDKVSRHIISITNSIAITMKSCENILHIKLNQNSLEISHFNLVNALN